MNEWVWKAFRDHPVTHSDAHYLMTIHEIQERKWYARASDVSQALEVSAPSCLQSLKKLVKNWFLTMNEDKFYLLTQKGFQQVLYIEKNKEVFLDFFTTILGASYEQSDEDSCKIEHLISPEISLKLNTFLKYCKQNNITLKDIFSDEKW